MDYQLTEPGGKFSLRKEIDSIMLSPGEWYEAAPGIRTLADLLDVARAQVRRERLRDANASIGGRLFLAEVSRDKLAIRSLGGLADDEA